jgi:preprotein translocase subunit SecG
MATIVTIIHVLACIFLVLVVLLQTGKGADMGAVFGGSSSTIFGSSGAGNFLTRLTTATAAIFMLTSLTLTYMSAERVTSTVFDSAPLPAPAAVGEPAASDAAAPVAEPAPQAAAPEAAQAEPPAAPVGQPQPQAAPAAQPEAAAPAAPEAAAPPAPANP